MKYQSIESSRLKIILNIVILLASIYGVSKKEYTVSQSTTFETLMMDSFAPLQRSIQYIRGSLEYTVNHYVFLVGTSKENVELKANVARLENDLFKMRELERENNRLKELLKFGEEIPREKVLAQVVGRDANSNFRVLRVNKGKNDGIKLYSTVVTAEGLVGYVYRVSRHFSDILTILDQNNRVDSIITRTRSHGISEGYSNYKCIMKYVTRTEPIILNDVVITAGLGNIYPKGLKVGTVSKIERESYGITQLVEVTPSVDFSKLEEVIILVSGENFSSEKIEISDSSTGVE